MPVVRIITSAPEKTQSLANELRSRGYAVQIVSPGDAPAGAADFEITLDTCPVSEALSYAAELGRTSDADVYVAPGLYRGERRPATERDSDQVAEHKAMTPDLEPTIEVQSVPAVQPLPRPEESGKRSVIRDAAVAIGAAAHRASAAVGELASTVSQRRSARRQQREQRRQQQYQMRQQRDQVRLTALQNRAAAAAPPSHRRAIRPQRKLLRDKVAVVGHKAGDSIGYLGEALFASVRSLSQWHVARQQRALARQQQQQSFAKPSRAASGAAVEPVRKPQLWRSRRSDRLPVIRRTRERDNDWAVAAAFSCVLVIGVMVAWAAANRRPASPLPASVLLKSNSLEQQVPFGPVKLAPPAHSGKTSPQAIGKTKPSPRRPASAPAQRARSNSGDEVIVRHFAPAHAARPAQVRAVKRYTDAEY